MTTKLTTDHVQEYTVNQIALHVIGEDRLRNVVRWYRYTAAYDT